MGVFSEDDSAGGASGGALFGDFLEGVGHGGVKGDADADGEATADEGKAEGFFCAFGDLDAEAAGDAFTGFKDDLGVGLDAFEGLAVERVFFGAGSVGNGVFSEGAAIEFGAIAVEAAMGFGVCLERGEGVIELDGCAGGGMGVGGEGGEFGFVEGAEADGECGSRRVDGVSAEVEIDHGCGLFSFGDGADGVSEGCDGGACGEDAVHAGHHAAALSAESLVLEFGAEGSGFGLIDFADGEEDGVVLLA